MGQTTRVRPHYEGSGKAISDARCSVCHRPVFEQGDAYFIDRKRRTRTCLKCHEEARIRE